MRNNVWLVPVLLASLGVGGPLIAGCGGGSDRDGAGGGGGSSSSDAWGRGGSDDTFGSGAGGRILAGGSGAAGPGGAGGEASCNGIDDDGNGIIDDVDVGGDGVCDCLNIATIGNPAGSGDPGIFTEWLRERSPLPNVDLGDQVLTPELLAPYQVIVALDCSDERDRVGNTPEWPMMHQYSPPEIEALVGWVQKGGGLMTTAGYAAHEELEVLNINQVLSSLGMGYDVNHRELNGDVKRWSPHPVTEGVTWVRALNGVEPEPHGTQLAWDQDGRLALDVKEVGDGKVLVWGDEWVMYNSEWENSRELQVERFWLNVLRWLSRPTVCQVPVPVPR